MAIEKKEKIRAVADASFLIGLSLIKQWVLLPQMVDELYVLPAVWEEVILLGQGKPGAKEMQDSEVIERHPIQNQETVEMLKVFLGPGEAETLVLAQERACSIVFLDDLKARKAAQKPAYEPWVSPAFFFLRKRGD